MAAYLTSAWDFARVGAAAMHVTDDGGSFEVRITSGRNSHVDISGIGATSNVTLFATTLQTALNAGSSGFSTYTVTPQLGGAAGVSYQIDYGDTVTISFTTGVTTAAEGVRMRQLLGFTGNPSPSDQISSDVPGAPPAYYTLTLARDGVSDYSRDFEASGQTQRQVSRNANAYSVGPLTYEKRTKFRVRFMALASVFADQATSATPFTFEHLVQHARCHEPIVLHTSTEDLVFKLINGDFDESVRKPVWNDYHGLWDLSIEGQVLGRL